MLRCPKTEEEWKELTARIRLGRNYHNCLAAVDGKQIAMKKPPSAGFYYYNDKGFHSTVLITVAIAKDSASYGRTWSNCSLDDAIQPLSNDDQPVPYHFVGYDAFGPRTWMTKTFSHQ